VLVAHEVEVRVPDGARILGPVSLEVAPGSLVALMGPNGSGKSTLIRVLAGVAKPTAGQALWGQQPTASAVQALGYVPQRESVHDRLTTREALRYAAYLRLDGRADIDRTVEQALDELGLTAQADTLIHSLSGGERRRAACGLELVGDPPVLLLDEPASGLDEVLERRLMQLLRRLASQDRAVLVATHATTSLDLCDEVIVLQDGQTVYRGASAGARAYVTAVAAEPPDAEPPDAEPVAAEPPDADPPAAKPTDPEERTEREAALARTEPSRKRVAESETVRVSRPFGRELRVLTARYLRTLLRDRRTLYLLVLQAPVIGLLIAIVFHSGALAASASPIGALEIVFLLMTGAIWLGVASAAREVVKERGLVEREFDVGIRLDAYVLSKALVLFALNFVQVLLLVIVVEALRPLQIGRTGVLELFVIALLTAWASAGMGLAVSCAARSVDQAAGAVPLLLMPQLLLAGGLIPLAQMPRIVSGIANVIYARWSYAGLGSAARIGARLAGSDSSSILGFDTGFFALTPATAVGMLLAFTVIELLVAVLLLLRRPPVTP
jgi:ABC-type multidrug transport system ATPase subunit/ABC-type multidrug transport system permease subunit